MSFIFFVGLSLTLERCFACIQKYINENVGTKITLEKSTETLTPRIILCANIAYNKRLEMNK